MSKRDEPTGMEEEMRPLPDGGLSEGMPEWLRRPPAWRDLPRKDEPATGEKSLPEPDTSVIDPRELVTVDDLPQWLRDIAARESGAVTESAAPAPDVPEEPVVITSAPAHTAPESDDSAPATPPATGAKTVPWIWAMRVAIILIILSIIYYVFIL